MITLSATGEQILTHLEFLGYSLDRGEKSVRAKHQLYLNLNVRDFAGGTMFTSWFGANDNAKQRVAEYLRSLNVLNQKARVARFYADPDLDLAIEAWYPRVYDKAQFGIFFDVLKMDHDLLRDADCEASRFIQ